MPPLNEHTPNKKAAIYTLGCRLNQAESAHITDLLTTAGYSLVPWQEKADLGVLHTCTITGEADTKSRKAVRAFIRRNPNAFVAVIGCYAERDATALAAIPGVDLIIGNAAKLDLLTHIRPAKNPSPVIVMVPLPSDHFQMTACGGDAIIRRANLKIQDGCDAACAYCIVPHVRGHSRSRPLDEITQEARQLVNRGCQEIVLAGVNLGRYAWEHYRLADVVDQLTALPGLPRLRISSLEMGPALETIIPRMAIPETPLMPFLHIPLQSGSASVLHRMNRRYTGDEFITLTQHVVSCIPQLGIGVDVLVGFPGETDAEFEETCRVLRASPIAYAHVFAYSARPGTPAADMPNQVPPKVMRERSLQVREMAAAKQAAFQAHAQGQIHEVLFECEEDGFWTGYTPNYLRVAVHSHEPLLNAIRTVRIGASRGQWVAAELV